jgi:hypothetical protein
VFGTRERHKREIEAREIGEREAISPVWYRREIGKSDQIFVDPTFFSVFPNLRRKEANGSLFHFYP